MHRPPIQRLHRPEVVLQVFAGIVQLAEILQLQLGQAYRVRRHDPGDRFRAGRCRHRTFVRDVTAVKGLDQFADRKHVLERLAGVHIHLYEVERFLYVFNRHMTGVFDLFGNEEKKYRSLQPFILNECD